MNYHFNEEEHTYWKDDEQIPSVTQIIRHFIPFKWGTEINMYFGRDVHRATELYDRGCKDLSSYSDEVLKRLEAWVDFKNSTAWENMFIEQKMYFSSEDFSFAGTADRIGTMKGRKTLTLIDIKASDGELKTANIQTAMYALLYRLHWPRLFPPEQHTICEYEIKQRAVVYLRSDGKFKPKRDIKTFDKSEDFEVARSMIYLYNWMVNNKHIKEGAE